MFKYVMIARVVISILKYLFETKEYQKTKKEFGSTEADRQSKDVK